MMHCACSLCEAAIYFLSTLAFCPCMALSPHEPSQGPLALRGTLTPGACYVRGRLTRLVYLAAGPRYGVQQTHEVASSIVPSELSVPHYPSSTPVVLGHTFLPSSALMFRLTPWRHPRRTTFLSSTDSHVVDSLAFNRTSLYSNTA